MSHAEDTFDWTAVKKLLGGALDLPEDARAAFLDTSCAGDADLRTRVEELLAIEKDADDFLKTPVSADPARYLPELLGLQPGSRFGSYVVRSVLGVGGTSVVYRAEQENPRRPIALKVLMCDLDRTNALQRFELETQLLARLSHPGIAQIHEAGIQERNGTAAPYLAIEWVPEARTVTEYAREHGLTARERVDLFAGVVDALGYAHQSGVIHRDIKPANILVDEAGRTKVIDFGVARTLDPTGCEASRLTKSGEWIGTLLYMSPEQCGYAPFQVDARSDVFSLGVVLFELVCGRLPYSSPLDSITSIAREIEEATPDRPSKLNPRLSVDLDAIILKCLSKEPQDRYTTAIELREDLGRYLDGRPVAARPPSATYYLRLFARRHRHFVAAAGFVLFALLASAFLVTGHSVRAAERETGLRLRSERITKFLASMLSAAQPGADVQRDPTVREVLDRASETLEEELGEEPETRAVLHATIGEAYFNLADYEEAEPHLRRAIELTTQTVGDQAVELIDYKHTLGVALRQRIRFEEAETLLREALADARRHEGAGPKRVAVIASDLGSTLNYAGRPAEAEVFLREALATCEQLDGREAASTAHSALRLGEVLYASGKLEEAEPHLLYALEFYGDERPLRTTSALVTLGALRGDLGEPRAALEHFERALALYREHTDEQHPDVAVQLYNVGSTLIDLGEYALAEERIREALDRLGPRLPPDSEWIQQMRLDYARAIMGLGDDARAVAILDRLVETSGDLGELDAEIRGHYGACLTRLGRFEEAEELLLESLEAYRAIADHEPAALERAHTRFADLYDAWGRPEESARHRDAIGQAAVTDD